MSLQDDYQSLISLEIAELSSKLETLTTMQSKLSHCPESDLNLRLSEIKSKFKLEQESSVPVEYLLLDSHFNFLMNEVYNFLKKYNTNALGIGIDKHNYHKLIITTPFTGKVNGKETVLSYILNSKIDEILPDEMKGTIGFTSKK